MSDVNDITAAHPRVRVPARRGRPRRSRGAVRARRARVDPPRPAPAGRRRSPHPLRQRPSSIDDGTPQTLHQITNVTHSGRRCPRDGPQLLYGAPGHRSGPAPDPGRRVPRPIRTRRRRVAIHRAHLRPPPVRRHGSAHEDRRTCMSNDPTLVVLGASGDLAARLLFPALFSLEHRERLENLRIIGYARQDWNNDQFHENLRAAIDRNCADVDDEVPRPVHRSHRVPRRRPVGRVAAGAEGAARRPRDVLSRLAARRVRRRRRDHLGGGIVRRIQRPAPPCDRKAVRHRPRERARAQRATPPGLARRPDLPHRPLPREGNRAEHAGVPVRQPVRRAGAPRRSRRRDPDHGRRDPRSRRSFPLLRRDRRAAAT